MATTRCICIFSAQYHPSMGGVQNYTACLANALTEKGYRVIVVACNTHGCTSRESKNDIEIVRLPCARLLGDRYPVTTRKSAKSPEWNWVKEQAIDYVIVNTRFYPLSLMALSFAKEKGIVPIVIEHGSAHLTMGNRVFDQGIRAIEHFITTRDKRYPAAYYGVSKKASSWLRHFGIESCGELPNSIDAEEYRNHASNRDFRAEFELPENAFVVAFVGRLVKEKGVLAIAEASAMLDAASNISILVAGDGPLSSVLEPYETGCFALLGRLNRADTAALLSQADVLLLPSRSEGFATTLLEAAACSTPAIVTRVGGTDELVPDESFGTIIPDAKPETIAAALENAARNQDAIRSQARLVRQRVAEGFSWSKTAEQALTACELAQDGVLPSS